MKRMHAEDELTKAAATGNTCRVQFLLSNRVNVNNVNKFGRTPIQVGNVFRCPNNNKAYIKRTAYIGYTILVIRLHTTERHLNVRKVDLLNY